ncbi:MAG TPA: hypothetical protein PLU24_00745 [Candidatus Omnitrophota bacterium]|nr:hypothetical protein [Candidatus Omnitrophota bacterium]
MMKKLIAVSLFLLFIFANFFTVRQLMRLGSELYYYDKLNVAFETAGRPGMEKEFERMSQEGGLAKEKLFANRTRGYILSLSDPGNYLESVVKDRQEKIALFRNLRNIAFILILVILFIRFLSTCEKKSVSKK